MPRQKITGDLLRGKGGDCKEVGVFEKEWPEGCYVTLANLTRALELGLDTSWFAFKFLTDTAREEYIKAIATTREDYRNAKATAWEDYDKAIATAREDYRNAKATTLCQAWLIDHPFRNKDVNGNARM